MGDEQTDLEEILYRKKSCFSEDDSIFESVSLTLVQALVLISNFTQKRNKPNTGWNYLGLAVRMALSLALHRELPEWDISLLQADPPEGAMRRLTSSNITRLPGTKEKLRNFVSTAPVRQSLRFTTTSNKAALPRLVAWYSLYESAHVWRTEGRSTNH